MSFTHSNNVVNRKRFIQSRLSVLYPLRRMDEGDGQRARGLRYNISNRLLVLSWCRTCDMFFSRSFVMMVFRLEDLFTFLDCDTSEINLMSFLWVEFRFLFQHSPTGLSKVKTPSFFGFFDSQWTLNLRRPNVVVFYQCHLFFHSRLLVTSKINAEVFVHRILVLRSTYFKPLKGYK